MPDPLNLDEIARACKADASFSANARAWVPALHARVVELEAALRRVNGAFNAAGLEVQMPDALGGEALLDALCDLQEALDEL